MLRYLAPPILLLYSSATFAAGCQNAPRFETNPTTVSIQTDTERPIPGQEITLTAVVQTPGRFVVACQNPDQIRQPWEAQIYTYIGGTIDILSGGNLIGSMRVAPENTSSTPITPMYVGSDKMRYQFHGAKSSSYKLKFTMPAAAGTQSFTARFSGDNYYAKGSSSPALTVQSRGRDITPALMLLLN